MRASQRDSTSSDGPPRTRTEVGCYRANVLILMTQETYVNEANGGRENAFMVYNNIVYQHIHSFYFSLHKQQLLIKKTFSVRIVLVPKQVKRFQFFLINLF